ncbi:hypothetical protein [Deinococcus cellulosilyticus]|nr:hypothetical protein [Deinococcus cellulosilyticus]
MNWDDFDSLPPHQKALLAETVPEVKALARREERREILLAKIKLASFEKPNIPAHLTEGRATAQKIAELESLYEWVVSGHDSSTWRTK